MQNGEAEAASPLPRPILHSAFIILHSKSMPSSHFILTLWTNDPAVARRADAAGVDRIGLDLETYGKAERQPKTLSTWISTHHENQLPALREVVRSGKLFC